MDGRCFWIGFLDRIDMFERLKRFCVGARAAPVSHMVFRAPAKVIAEYKSRSDYSLHITRYDPKRTGK